MQKITIISNIFIEAFLISELNALMEDEYLSAQAEFVPYEECFEVEYEELFYQSELIVVLLNLEGLMRDLKNCDLSLEIRESNVMTECLNMCKHLFSHVYNSSKAKVLWFLFEDYGSRISVVQGHLVTLADEINFHLRKELHSIEEQLGNEKRTEFINLKNLIAEVGISAAFDNKNKYRWNFPYSKVMTKVLAKEVFKHYLIYRGFSKKCLVLDCDNVLWGGILSEEGLDHIQLGKSGLGREYQEFQRFLLSLHKRGVILAICSKNDLDDVLFVFHEHSEMILREEHIACFEVNWKNKPDNIKKISERLNISTDSMVFVDDSPVEIGAVKAMLPEITAILYHRDSMYDYFGCFNLKSDVDDREVMKRNKTYLANRQREDLKTQYKSFDEYIKALEMKVDIHKVLPVEYNRIAELTQRTNKCTNGIRYSVTDIKTQVECETVSMYSVFLEDRYSDLGLIGVVGVNNDRMTLFSVSCRALGRKIEKTILSYIKEKHSIKDFDFKTTGKNGELHELLAKTLISDGRGMEKSYE